MGGYKIVLKTISGGCLAKICQFMGRFTYARFSLLLLFRMDYSNYSNKMIWL